VVYTEEQGVVHYSNRVQEVTVHLNLCVCHVCVVCVCVVRKVPTPSVSGVLCPCDCVRFPTPTHAHKATAPVRAQPRGARCQAQWSAAFRESRGPCRWSWPVSSQIPRLAALPSKCQKRPSERTSKCQKRPSKRPIKCQKRPSKTPSKCTLDPLRS
jgi:hypothetical protein